MRRIHIVGIDDEPGREQRDDAHRGHADQPAFELGVLGLVRRTRFGARCEEAVEVLCHALPPSARKRLIIVDAGIATHERFAAATAELFALPAMPRQF